MKWLVSWFYEEKTIEIQNTKLYEEKTTSITTHDGGERRELGQTGLTTLVPHTVQGGRGLTTFYNTAPAYGLVTVKNQPIHVRTPSFSYWCCTVTGNNETINSTISIVTENSEENALKECI